eukprot:jgi/Hompol1/2199/HPOL_005885-RA
MILSALVLSLIAPRAFALTLSTWNSTTCSANRVTSKDFASGACITIPDLCIVDSIPGVQSTVDRCLKDFASLNISSANMIENANAT